MLYPTDFLREYGTQFPAWSLQQSLRYTRDLAKAHYENFLVAGWLVPKRLRQDYCNLYAFCRWADDLGDEIGDSSQSLELLSWWREQLVAMESGEAFHPVFVALRETAVRHSLPRSEFEDLVAAFEADQTVTRYASYGDLLGYCRNSANPVGRLVLRFNGYRDDSLFALSDAVCTALQLANHWQDVRRDWDMGRVYVPEDTMAAHEFSYERLASDMAAAKASPSFRRTLRDLVGQTRDLFLQGLPLADRLPRRLGCEIELFARSGLLVLDAIEAQRYDTIASRPALSKRRLLLLSLSVAGRHAVRRVRSRGTLAPVAPSDLTERDASRTGDVRHGPSGHLASAYAHCRLVAKAEAKNFYHAFHLLTRERRRAMCAVYAFMRHSDDIADNVLEEPAVRGERLSTWRHELGQALRGGTAGGPVLSAFSDTVERYSIPHSYFFDLLDGMESDLVAQRYQSFEDLYRYCYRAASVVGMATIHVLGFEREAAIRLAERCGIAFQLTNILRDVAADAGMGRVYLPSDELREFGLAREDLLHQQVPSSDERFQRFMEFQWLRAERYYTESAGLLGMISSASRPALWALMSTYHGLLLRIRQSGYDVFRSRVSLPTSQKLAIVTRASLWRAVGRELPFPA